MTRSPDDRRYEQPPALTREQAEHALDDEGADAQAVAAALISAALSVDDDAWLEGRLSAALRHDSPLVRAAAARACGHLARVHGGGGERAGRLRALLEPLLQDPAVRGAARDALDDVETFC